MVKNVGGVGLVVELICLLNKHKEISGKQLSKSVVWERVEAGDVNLGVIDT